MFQPGTKVICIDNENMETMIQKNRRYVVKSSSHRGAFIRLQGIVAAFASSRFVIADESLPPSSMESIHASH